MGSRQEIRYSNTDRRIECLGQREGRGEFEEARTRVLDEVDYHATRTVDNALRLVSLV